MKTFDVEKFNLKKNKEHEYTYEINGFLYEESGGLSSKEFIRYVHQEKNNFREFYRFFPNGNIKIKGNQFKNNFNSGIWTYYDINGTIINEKNYDKPFIFNWEKIKEYLKEHDVNDIKKQVIGISRWHDEEETTWTLEFNGTYNNILGRYVITLNGKTGEELEVKLFKGKRALGKTGTIADYKIILKR